MIGALKVALAVAGAVIGCVTLYRIVRALIPTHAANDSTNQQEKGNA
jgi:hypothetical protein